MIISPGVFLTWYVTNVTLKNVCLQICATWWTGLWQKFNANVLSFSRLEKQARLLVFLPLHFLFWDENWPFWRLSECQIPGVAKMRRALSVHAILHSIYIRAVSAWFLFCSTGFNWFMGRLSWAISIVHSFASQSRPGRNWVCQS